MDENQEEQIVENPTEVVSEPEIEIVDEGFEPDTGSREPENTKPLVDEDEERQKKHISLKTQFNRVQRDKLRAEHEADVLRKELEKYRSIADRNSEAAMGHYDKTIELQIQQAKAEKKAAKEAGDYDAEIAADEKLALAAAQKAQNESYRAQQTYLKAQQEEQAKQVQEEQQYQQEYEQPEINDDAKEWLQNNPWFINSKSEDDRALAQEVQSFSEILERKYRRQGMEDKLFTKDYFDEVDSYIREQIMQEAPVEKAQPARNNLNMKPVRQTAPVGRSPKGPDAPARRTVTLSPQEKEMAKIMNLNEQDYAKWKIKDQEKQAQRGRPY